MAEQSAVSGLTKWDAVTVVVCSGPEESFVKLRGDALNHVRRIPNFRFHTNAVIGQKHQEIRTETGRLF